MAKKKAAPKPTAKEVAKKVDAAKPGTATAQALIPDVFPKRDEELERLGVQLIEKEAALKRAREAFKDADRALNDRMEELKLDVYKFYTFRKKAVHSPRDAETSLRKIKKDEASPCKKEGDEK